MDQIDELCCASLSTRPMQEADAETLANILKALADPVRLQLVSLVASEGEACACDLPALVNRSQPTVSHHLKQLVDAGILEREQRGRWAWFRVQTDQLEKICGILC